jgi:MFS family permease
MEIGRVHPRSRSGLVNFEWYNTLAGNSKKAFWASAGGWALDSFDYQVLGFGLVAIGAAFHLSAGQKSYLGSVILIVSALGGVLAGMLADRIGRVKTLMVTVGVYSLFTFLSGLAQSYPQLLVLRSLQGLGFGGEWAAGAALIAEMADPEHRGRVLGWVQSFWAIGWGAALVAFVVVYSIAGPKQGWRILFWLGILPALLLLYIRRNVHDSEVYKETRNAREAHSEVARERHADRPSLVQIFMPDLLKVTAPAALLAAGAQGGYYAIFFWLPTYLLTERHLAVLGTGFNLFPVIIGAFGGYVTSAYVNDAIGRKKTFALFAIVSAIMVVLYTQLPQSAVRYLWILGLVLGFTASGIFSGFGSYLAELYPSRARGAGQGFCYNFGRAVGGGLSLPIIGLLSATSLKLGGAIAFAAVAYGICLVALLFLPETRGKTLVAID